MKICSRCKAPKELSEFYNNTRTKDGKYAYCKVCSKFKVRKFHELSSEEYKKHFRVRVQISRCVRLYGVTEPEYIEMFNSQGGLCKICGQPERRTKTKSDTTPRRLAIDHDHLSGKVRGLLCFRCNTLLGSVDENAELLKQMIEYLKS